MKTGIRLCVSLALLLVALMGTSLLLALTNEPSDLLVGVGYVGTLALWVGCGLAFKLVWADFARRAGLFALLLTAGLATAACGTTVQPGYVGIKVNKWGTNRGVNDYPIHTGWVSYNFYTEDVITYPTFTQTAVWTHNVNEGNPINEEITFTNKDQLSISADISLAYEMVADRVPAFYVKFRSDDITKFTHGFLRNLAREKFDSVAGKYPIEQIMGDNAPLLEAVRVELQKVLDPIGVKITQFGFIGAPRPPSSVIDAINMKIKATQDAMRTENELRQAQVEAQKAIAWAEGQAQSNRVLAASISPQLLEWKRLELQFRTVDRWNGVPPNVAGTSAVPFFQLK